MSRVEFCYVIKFVKYDNVFRTWLVDGEKIRNGLGPGPYTIMLKDSGISTR